MALAGANSLFFFGLFFAVFLVVVKCVELIIRVSRFIVLFFLGGARGGFPPCLTSSEAGYLERVAGSRYSKLYPHAEGKLAEPSKRG